MPEVVENEATPGWATEGGQEVGSVAALGGAGSHSTPPSPSRLLTMRELRQRPKPRWLIEDVLPEEGIGSIFGPTYSGKTFVGIDLALSVANGLSYWHGSPSTPPGLWCTSLWRAASTS